jgi:anti-sigma-K factor RskA
VSDRAEERNEAIAAYLMGELDEDARAEFDLRLQRDPELRAELEAVRPVVSKLEALPEEAWNAPEPPPLAVPVAEAADAQPAPSRSHQARGWRWTPARLAIAGGVAALLLGVGVWVGTLVDDDAAPADLGGGQSIVLTPVGDEGSARGELTVAGGPGGRANLDVSGLPPNADDYYEVWLLGDRGLVSLGSFRVDEDGAASVDLELPVNPARYGSFDVSLEPDDGDPSHSSDSVLRGPTSS